MRQARNSTPGSPLARMASCRQRGTRVGSSLREGSDLASQIRSRAALVVGGCCCLLRRCAGGGADEVLRPWRPAEDGCAVTGCCLMTSTRGLAVFVSMYRGVMTMLRLTGAVTAELPATPTFFATSARTRFQCQRCFGCEPAGRSSGCCAAPLPGLCTQAQSCCTVDRHRLSSVFIVVLSIPIC